MKLTYEQLSAALCGAVRTWQDSEGFHGCRFTQPQVEAYFRRREDFGEKALSSSGLVLRFRSDSPWMKLDITVKHGSSRNYFSVDVVADGKHVDSIRNWQQPPYGTNFVEMEAPLGDFSQTFDLGPGEKELAVYLPWSMDCAITSLELEEGSSFLPVKRPGKMLVYGDSITQGYDALEPRNKYITQLANRLGLEEVNKAIGGEVFWPELAAMTEDFVPTLITVAYGTNDWSKLPREEAEANCRAFYATVRKAYPDTPILAITPVWRPDTEVRKPVYGPFERIEAMIRETAAEVPGITVVSGWEFIPQDINLYADLRLHPNDAGFQYYFENLAKAIQK